MPRVRMLVPSTQERAVGQRAGLVGQHPPVGAALAERLQRRQALHRVEELLAECLECALPLARRARRCARAPRDGATRVNSAAPSITLATGTSQNAMKAKIASGAQAAIDTCGRYWPKKVCSCSTPSIIDSITPPVRSRAEPGRTERDDLVVKAARAASPAPAPRCGARSWCARGRARRAAGSRRACRPAAPPVRRSVPRGTAGRGTGRGRRSARCRWRAPAGQAGCPARSATRRPLVMRHSLRSKCTNPSRDSVAILGVLVGIAQTRYFQPLLSYIERR